jgi:hypothetical protein
MFDVLLTCVEQPRPALEEWATKAKPLVQRLVNERQV